MSINFEKIIEGGDIEFYGASLELVGEKSISNIQQGHRSK